MKLLEERAVVSHSDESDLGYYGWRVVLAACLGVMGGFGSLFVYTFTVFVKPLGTEFGWNRESVSVGFAIAAMTVGLSSPLIGRLLDRLGPRRIILPSMIAFGCGVASLALLRRGIWQFYATCFLIGLVGNGAAHLAYARSISTWFHRRLGTALAFVMVGAGLGAMILPVVAQSVVTNSGWRAAYISLGGIALLLGLPLSWKYIVERGSEQKQNTSAQHSGATWQEGVQSLSFWVLVLVLFVSSISMNGAITHLSALLTDRGITARNAALCASILGGTSIFGRVGTGWLLDRFFGARVAFLVNLMTAAGVVVLAKASSFGAGALAAALLGIGAGGEAAITPYLLTRCFGLRSFSTLYGLTWTFYAAAGATGPILLGRAFDSTGSYTSSLLIFAAALGLAAALYLLLPKYLSQQNLRTAWLRSVSGRFRPVLCLRHMNSTKTHRVRIAAALTLLLCAGTEPCGFIPEARAAQTKLDANKRPFDKLELFSFFVAGPVAIYAKILLQERGTDFTPDAEFINSFPSGVQQEILRRVHPATTQKASPARDQAYRLVLKAYQDQRSHQYQAASAGYQKALQLAPDSATLHLAYAGELLFAKDFAHSDEQARMASKLWPDYAEAHGMLALSMVLQKRSAEAETESKETLRLFPGHASAKFTLAQSLTNEHKYKEAIPAIRAAMVATPSMTALTKFLGIALRETGDTAGAIAALSNYVRIDPTDAEGHYAYGMALKAKGEREQAHVQLAEAARLQPNNLQYKSAAEN